jgi:hypothetical protein
MHHSHLTGEIREIANIVNRTYSIENGSTTLGIRSFKA